MSGRNLSAPPRGASWFTRAILIALPLGLGWLGGTTLRARRAVRAVPVPAMDSLDFRGAGMTLSPIDAVSPPDPDVRPDSPGAAATGSTGSAGRVPVLRVFGDYECASCQRMERAIGDSLRTLAAAGLLTMVYHHAPLRTHHWGRSAAGIAYCAAGTKFGPLVHAALFVTAEELPGDSGEPALHVLAGVADSAVTDSIVACIADGTARARAMRDRELAEALGVVAVPTLFLDGSRLEFTSYASLLDHVARAVRAAARSAAS